MKKIYIVTGANGFLGNNIIRKLEQDDNNEIRAFVLNGESIKSLEKKIKVQNILWRCYKERNLITSF